MRGAASLCRLRAILKGRVARGFCDLARRLRRGIWARPIGRDYRCAPAQARFHMQALAHHRCTSGPA
jgi:hypothetical protein